MFRDLFYTRSFLISTLHLVLLGGCRAYKGEARILKLADFVGEGIPMGNVEPVTYATVDKWKKASPELVKVLLFRKSFTAMVLAFREVKTNLT